MPLSLSKLSTLPVITIQKNNGTLYTFNPLASPQVFDFRLIRAEFTEAYLNAAGSFELKIYDPSASMLGNIRRGNEITFWVGKTDAGKQKILLGMIDTVDIETVTHSLAYLILRGKDWGSTILQSRIITFFWKQQLLASGEPDLTDTSTSIKQIVSDILGNQGVYPTQEPLITTQGIIYNENNIDANIRDLQIPTFASNYEFANDKLRQLDELAINAVHGVDPDKTFWMRRPKNEPSGVIIVDDKEDPDAANWPDQTKVGIVSGHASSHLIKTIADYKRRVFGVGAGQNVKESSLTTITSFDSLTQYRAQQILNTTEQVSIVNKKGAYIAVYLSRSGTVSTDVLFELVEDVNGKPKGSTLGPFKIDRNAIQTFAKIHFMDLGGQELNTAAKYWIVARPNSAVRWHKEPASASSVYTHAISGDGVNWIVTGPGTSSSYGYAHEYWFFTDLALPKEDDTTSLSSAVYFEDTLRQPDIHDAKLMHKFLDALPNATFKEKWIYKCEVRLPDFLLKNGQTVRIKTTKSPLANFDKDDWIITNLDYVFDSSQDPMGMMYANLTAIRHDLP